MKKENDISLGRFISLILRHKPETIGITIEKQGAWANVSELIEGMNKAGKNIDMNTLERIVKENNKQRYSFNKDHTKIRANQGHSIEVYIDFEEKIPPKTLYHGTAGRFLESIKKTGINKMNRLYVHLSKDEETAITVGKRHGKPIVLKIDTEEMLKDGYKFYLSENNVWLCEDIPWKYVRL